MNPDISIIIPIYNAGKTIQKCVDSVLNQTYPSFELILVDDGSTDDSRKRCECYSATDKRIKTFHQKNKGVSEARNAGLAQASGKYIFFLDSDDELYPDTLERYMELILRCKADIVIGSLEVPQGSNKSLIGFKNQEKYGKEIWEKMCLSFEPFGYVIGKMYKADLAKRFRFNSNMISQEDLDYNLDIFNLCSSIVVTTFSGYVYHYSKSQRKPQFVDYIANQLKLFDYAKGNYSISDKAKKAVLERIAKLAYTALYNAASKKEYQEQAERILSLHTLEKTAGAYIKHKTKHAVFMERIIKRDLIPVYMHLQSRRKAAEMMRIFK